MDETERDNGGFFEFIEVEVVHQFTSDDHELGDEGNGCRFAWHGREGTGFLRLKICQCEHQVGDS